MSQSSVYGQTTAGSVELLSESDVSSQYLRQYNFVIDTLILCTCFFALEVLTEIIAPGFVEQASDTFRDVLFIATLIVYYAVFEATCGRTPAKFLTGTRVVAADGGRASVGPILVRSLVRLVPFEPLSFASSKHPVGWHDRWSGTRVVRNRRSARQRQPMANAKAS